MSNVEATVMPWKNIQSIMARAIDRADWTLLMVFALGSYTGYRVKDWQSLRWSDVLDSNAAPRNSISRIEAKTRHHGKASRPVVISQPLGNATVMAFEGKYPYWKRMPSRFLNMRIFMSALSSTGYMTTHGIIKVIKNAAKVEGLDVTEDWSTHSLRKGYATFLYERFKETGMPVEEAIRRIQMDLGHSTPEMTMRYLGVFSRKNHLRQTRELFDQDETVAQILKNANT